LKKIKKKYEKIIKIFQNNDDNQLFIFEYLYEIFSKKLYDNENSMKFLIKITDNISCKPEYLNIISKVYKKGKLNYNK
jgi:hypothetical protein